MAATFQLKLAEALLMRGFRLDRSYSTRHYLKFTGEPSRSYLLGPKGNLRSGSTITNSSSVCDRGEDAVVWVEKHFGLIEIRQEQLNVLLDEVRAIVGKDKAESRRRRQLRNQRW